MLYHYGQGRRHNQFEKVIFPSTVRHNQRLSEQKQKKNNFIASQPLQFLHVRGISKIFKT